MTTTIAYKGRVYRAEQNRRGMGEEADLVISFRGSEIYRSSIPKLKDTDELKEAALKVMEDMKHV